MKFVSNPSTIQFLYHNRIKIDTEILFEDKSHVTVI